MRSTIKDTAKNTHDLNGSLLVFCAHIYKPHACMEIYTQFCISVKEICYTGVLFQFTILLLYIHSVPVL